MPVDDSAAAHCALNWTLENYISDKIELHLVHVYEKLDFTLIK